MEQKRVTAVRAEEGTVLGKILHLLRQFIKLGRVKGMGHPVGFILVVINGVPGADGNLPLVKTISKYPAYFVIYLRTCVTRVAEFGYKELPQNVGS